jgi:crotonobetainyl-CoA:carnitine CoA-transferase CaiB-like acyl-CoA transferase
MVVDLPHTTEGTIRTLGSPLKLSDTPPTLRHASPTHGEDTAQILAAIGLSDVEIARLRAQGAIRG